MRNPQDWGQPCPHPVCTHSRRLPQGNGRALATSLTHSGTRRLLRCHPCETPVSETRAPVFVALRTSEATGMLARTRLLVRGALAGLSCGRGGTEEPGLAWRRRAASQADARNHHRRPPRPVTQGQREAMGPCSGRQQAQETDVAGESLPDSAAGRPGGGGSCAPALRLMRTALGGPRTLDTAPEVVAGTQARVAGLPAVFSTGFPGSLAALSAACPVVTTFARPGKRGRPRQPRGEPPPALRDGPWVPQPPHGTVRTRSPRGVVGPARLPPRGLRLSTAWVARVHVPVRQALAPLARKTSSLWQDRERRRQRVGFVQAFAKRASPHMRVPPPLAQHAQTRHGAIRPRGRQQTPARAAGLTDHVWTFRERLTVKFEPLNAQSMSG